MRDDEHYRGWRRPGPIPPGGVEPEDGETRDYICGHFRIFQYAKGHRYSTDDVLTAWYGTTCAPSVARAADLGSGIGSVATIVAWRLPGAVLCTVEAQEMSIRLARKSMRYNGLESRVMLYQGDLRDATVLGNEKPFDLVTGSPPYWPEGTATTAEHPQAVPARIEVRGSVFDYAQAAARILAPGGVFAFVFPTAQLERALAAIAEARLALVRRRDVIFKEGDAPLITLFAATRADDIPPTYEAFAEPPLTIRRADGGVDAEYSAIRMSFGFPPGNVP
ncbi:MAG TPA: methyltransferase [Thermoanaerobaculia bacterium]|nr:methyltransferase [Thermoanaerobaculia bacterium]